ncbi:MAG TPA: DUF3052 domain-containing protein [Natronosporangium sp.]
MGGYSGTPLPAKLGIKPGHLVALLGAPDGFDATLGELPASVTVRRDLRGTRPLDVILLFTVWRAELVRGIERARPRMAATAGLWVAWPKRAAKLPTDLTEDVVREVALPTGLVDNKVCAIDQTWSGLRLVIRRELRR